MSSTILRYEGLHLCVGKDVVAISASEARRRLYPLIEQVNDDHEPVEIVSSKGSAVLMSKDDFDSWRETDYLFRSPVNARRLLRAYEDSERFREGDETGAQRRDLVEP